METLTNKARARVEFAFAEKAFFPECHASCVLPTAEGVLVVYFAGAHEKADDVGIWLSVKDLHGWRAPRCIARVAEQPHWNPVIFAIHGGVRVVFKVGKEIADWESWHMESKDGGQTWTQPQPYGAACGPVRSKPLTLSNGEMLAPNSVETEESWRAYVDVSKDEGASFVRRAEIPLNCDQIDAPNYIRGKGAIQPTLWESAPGHVHALLRTTTGFIFRADSTDYGHTFCQAYSTGLPNNNSGIDIVRAKDALYLALNPVSGNWAARTPLSILKSVDDGAHFSPFCVVSEERLDPERGTSAELSYPSVAFDGKNLHVTFTFMRRTIGYAKIPLGEMTV